MDSRKVVYQETGIIVIGQVVCLTVMYAIFALLGYFDRAVLLGGLVGMALAVGNFFFMAVGASLAADKAVQQDVKGGAGLVKSSYILRMAVLFLILLAAVKSGYCNAISSVLPLIFVRPIITIAEFFRKPGEKQS